MNRRYFLGSAAAGFAVRRAVAASDKVNVALIGLRGRGKALARNFSELPDVNFLYMCDVDENVVEGSAKVIEEHKGKRPPLIGDLRKALDDKNVDAILVATPDHWHGPATILGCNAGKDVYCEKPASHNLREGRLMVEAARKNKRVVQIGTQARSRASTMEAVEYVRSGKIGKVLMAKAWDVQKRDYIGHKEDSPIPKGVDFETWTGPAPMLPFNENRYHYKWHWNWNYGTGDAGNDGVHQIDMARWALGVETPIEAAGMGRKVFFDDDQQTPDTMNITFSYPDGRALIWEMRIWTPYGMEEQENGVAVYGSEAQMQIGRWNRKWGWKLFDKDGKLVNKRISDEGDYGSEHARNFIDCVKSRKTANADIEIGHTSTIHAHLGNIVARVNRTLKFDPKTETIASDTEANKLVRRQYRNHWATPKGV